MTIQSDDRQVLCRMRLEQMRVSANSCKVLLENEDLQGAANRLYYAVFYALSALAVSSAISFSKHGTLIGWFNKEYVLTGKVDRSFGRFVNDAWQTRSRSDYDIFVKLQAGNLQKSVKKLNEFIENIESLLQQEPIT